ncbi:MAG: tRNA pseudouridine(55) synthase TruB [Anaerolineae bacterium]|nr:tRNA pseudouridine(55) synthase TruB [Thermoflexales bacterium]MDW8407992.1 tRNA pseudouridine(55) synthase TruB [Anaerolineae bacterium]
MTTAGQQSSIVNHPIVNRMDGLLLIDKPRGMTSHDVVARVRRWTGVRQVGHAGTLDPLATGLLVLCVGYAVRLSEYLTGKEKAYIGRIKLGERTSTDDAEGELIARRDVQVTQEDLARIAPAFTGEIWQTPPQYSAVQVQGRRAYKLARRGEHVDLAPRRVVIHELTLTPIPHAVDSPFVYEVEMRVTCSAGAYIRALARDIGEALGCGAHLTLLRRTRSGSFTLAEAVTLDQLEQAAHSGTWSTYLLPADRAVEDMPRCDLDNDTARRLQMGRFVPFPSNWVAAAEGGLCRVYDAGGCFVALAVYDAHHALLKPAKVLVQPQLSSPHLSAP